jgi:hypothetical protein
MARRLKRSSLIFGQIQKPATTPSLAGYYKGVAAGRRGAVQEIGKGVEEKTRGLTGELGLTETVDADTGEVSTGMGDKFKATVTVPGADGKGGSITGGAGTVQKGEKPSESKTLAGPNITTTGTVRTTTGASSLDDLSNDQEAFKKALETLGKSISDWEASGVDAKAYLDSLLANTRANANEVIKEVNQRLEEENLGQRREPSETEKQAQSYQNIIANEPGTSNIKALANLSKFYDMARYGAVESGIRQGELALSREEMQGEKEAMETAEGARSAAIKDYGEQSKRLTGELGTELTEQETEERKKLSEFFDTGKDTLTDEEKRLKGEQENIGKDITKKEEEEVNTLADSIAFTYKNSNPKYIMDILEQDFPEGSHLRNRGKEVMQPLQTKLASLSDQIEQIKTNPNIDNKTKKKRLEELQTSMDDVRRSMAGELTAFLDDRNFRNKDPHQAMDAISFIKKAGLDRVMTEQQKQNLSRIATEASREYLSDDAIALTRILESQTIPPDDIKQLGGEDQFKLYLERAIRAQQIASVYGKGDPDRMAKLNKLTTAFYNTTGRFITVTSVGEFRVD